MGWETIKTSPRWLWIAVLWGGMGLFDASDTVLVMRSEGMHHNWAGLFTMVLLSWLPWALATPLVMQLGLRYPPVKLRPLSHWWIHLSAAAAIDIVASAWRAGLNVALNPWANPSGAGSFSSLWLDAFNGGLLVTIIFYASIVSIGFVLDSRERIAHQAAETARLNEQLTRAQLEALRHQFEPHFLFNALNAVSALVREGRNDDAVEMIAGLGGLLRRVLRDSATHQVSLQEELQFLDSYLAIQRVRFSNRLAVVVEVPPELMQARVPCLALQPIVENALKHGIEKRAQGGEVRILASRVNGHLNLRVYNDGPQLTPDWQTNGCGAGLANLVSRLRGLYGNDFGFELSSVDAGGVQASLLLPYRDGAGQEG
jgi:two-component sensor histidine kinase